MIVLVDPHIPGYRVERLIGSGGMASVYLAIQESLERPVALKVLDDPESAEYQERFLNEGRIIASLTHTNIVTVHDIGIAHRHLYISMEYVEGGDLRKRIRQGIGTAEAFEIVEKIGNALKLAHDRGVIHRDVKPANILFRTDGTPLLADFGIAKDYQRDSDLTLDGSLVGSPYYLSPEQARAHPIDGRADIYSLGVILYEMLTGSKPFKGESAVDTVFKHLNDPLPMLPEELVRAQWIIDRMLAKQPEERFADTGELVEAVRQIKSRGFEDLDDRVVRGSETVKMPAAHVTVSPRTRVLRGAARAGAVSATLAGIAIGAWLYLAPSEGTGRSHHDLLAADIERAAAARASGAAPAQGRLAAAADSASSGAGPARTSGQARGTGGEDRRTAAALTATTKTAPVEPAKRAEAPPREVPPEEASAASAGKTAASAAPEKPAHAPEPKRPTAAPPKRASKSTAKSGSTTSKPKRSVRPEKSTRTTTVARAPPPAPRKNPRELEIERLLRLGRARLGQGKLTTPARDSALYYRDEVLALDPDNRHARRLGDDIVHGYVELAESSLAKGDYFSAKTHIDRGLDVDPSNERLQWLRENALKQSARGFLNVFQRSLTTTEPKASQPGVRPDN